MRVITVVALISYMLRTMSLWSNQYLKIHIISPELYTIKSIDMGTALKAKVSPSVQILHIVMLYCVLPVRVLYFVEYLQHRPSGNTLR